LLGFIKLKQTTKATGKKGAGGRPRKFAEPSRPITVTLPNRVLDLLAALDEDRAKAITKVTESCLRPMQGNHAVVEVVEVAPGAGLIVVGPSRRLKNIPCLRLAEIAPGRFIITIVPGTPVETLEIAVTDLLDGLRPDEETDRQVLSELLKGIRTLRRGKSLSKAELLFVSVKPGKK
jgi:hypothetical protein